MVWNRLDFIKLSTSVTSKASLTAVVFHVGAGNGLPSLANDREHPESQRRADGVQEKESGKLPVRLNDYRHVFDDEEQADQGVGREQQVQHESDVRGAAVEAAPVGREEVDLVGDLENGVH